jgi:hypothetical protein
MDLTWTDPDQDQHGVPAFTNTSSPYAHYWLTLNAAPEEADQRRTKRRSVVDVSTRLDAGLDELIDRAFGS